MINRVLRSLALALAIVAAIDPSVTMTRPVRPEVGLIVSPHLPDSGLGARVHSRLARHFTVIAGAPMGAAAIVSVGFQLPAIAVSAADAGLGNAVAFAVVPEPRDPFVTIESIEAPVSARVQALVPVRAAVRAWAGGGRTIELELRQRGVAIARVARPANGDEVSDVVLMEATAAGTGLQEFEIVATVAGTPARASGRVTVAMDAGAMPVLAFDLRPSWMATFVRRALEADPRFDMTSRTTTTRGSGAIAGAAPAALTGPRDLDPYRTVIVGAPELLRASDVTALERYMRERAGTVVLLVDQPVPGPAVQRLTGVSAWRETLSATSAGMPAASETVTPVVLPPWLEPFGGASSIWWMPVGRGCLVVSGALDAWRFRNDEAGGFDRFWASTVAELAAGAAAASRVVRVAPDERALIEHWTAGRGGGVIEESRLDDLASRLIAQLSPAAEPRVMHPMRSPWWIVPFGTLLGLEWWRRRRAGLR